MAPATLSACRAQLLRKFTRIPVAEKRVRAPSDPVEELGSAMQGKKPCPDLAHYLSTAIHSLRATGVGIQPREMSRNYFHLHLVSDATGETLIAASRAASALYPGVSAIEHVYPLGAHARSIEPGHRRDRARARHRALYPRRSADLRPARGGVPHHRLPLALGAQAGFRSVRRLSRHGDDAACRARSMSSMRNISSASTR